MYCPKCGTENPDGAQLCRSCSWVLTSAFTPPAADARTSALAVTSLVLAILSFCTFFITAPVAIILGIVALFSIEKSRGRLKGRGLAIAGIAVPCASLPMVALMMGILMPALARTRQIAYRMACGANLSALGKAMFIYAGDNDDKYPDCSQWCDLLLEYADADPLMFRCRGVSEGPANYAMNKNIVELGPDAPPDMVLLFESVPGWNLCSGRELLTLGNHQGDGCNIMFNDGSVRFVRAKDVNDLHWNVEPER